MPKLVTYAYFNTQIFALMFNLFKQEAHGPHRSPELTCSYHVVVMMYIVEMYLIILNLVKLCEN